MTVTPRVWADDPRHPVNVRHARENRVIYMGAAAAAIFVGGYLAGASRAGDEAPPTTTTTTTVNYSSDGRYQTCGIITPEGVTEHIDEYIARCGDVQVLEP